MPSEMAGAAGGEGSAAQRSLTEEETSHLHTLLLCDRQFEVLGGFVQNLESKNNIVAILKKNLYRACLFFCFYFTIQQGAYSI